MIEYIVENDKYSLSYRELRDLYSEYIRMEDSEFMEKLPSALHLACIICYLKEVPSYLCLSDKGIIHELTHLLQHGEHDKLINLKNIRKLFKKQLKLV